MQGFPGLPGFAFRQGEQVGPAWPKLMPEALHCMANEFCWCFAGPSTTPPCLNYKGPTDQPFPGVRSNPAQGLQQ